MHNGIELSVGNVLILLLGVAVAWWMARAPKSLLHLMSTRLPGLDTDHPWLTWLVRWWGRFTFFSLTFGLLILMTPASYSNMPGVSIATLVAAIGISVVALRKPRKELFAALSSSPNSRR